MIQEDRDDISACTFENDSVSADFRSSHYACSLSNNCVDVVRLHQPLQVVVDAVPSIPSLKLDSVGSQHTSTSSCADASQELCSFKSFTEPPLRRRRPRCYEEELDASDHSRAESTDTWYTAATSNVVVEAPRRHSLFRPRFRPRFLLRPRRLLHAHTSPTQQLRQRLIPAEHPIKLLWDFLTVFLSFVHAYATHQSIRDRQFGNNVLIRFCELWFMLDILLNFFTERHVQGRRLTDYKSVWARYLTSWFVVDVLSLVPFEVMIIQPIIEQQNRRGFFKKSFFRTKAVVRVSHIVLKNGYIQLFGKAARQTKPFGIGANRLLQLLIKYLPKYWLFLRNMKAVIAVRVLRQFHILRKVYHNWRRVAPAPPVEIEAPTENDDLLEQDDLSLDSLDHHRLLYYADWELVEEENEAENDDVGDDDDEGVPY